MRVPWPPEKTLRKIVAQHARPIAAERGAPWIWPALAGASLGYLDRVRGLLWPAGVATVMGVEALGQTVFGPGGSLGEDGVAVNFKVDRIDKSADGESLVLIDYKTGKPGSSPSTVIPRGLLLQGVIYALSAPDIEAGRYAYLAEGLTENKAIVDVTPELAEAGVEVVRTIVGSWRQGVLFPRLAITDGSKEGDPCRWCDLKAACLHGEPGVRHRLVDAFDDMEDHCPLRAHWLLPDLGKARKGSGS